MNAPGGQIEEYYSKALFSRRFPGFDEAKSGLDSASQRLCRLIAGFAPEDLAWRPALGKWSRGQIADHVAHANAKFRLAIRSCCSGLPATVMPKGRLSEEGKPISPLEAEPREGRDGEELVALVRRSAEALIEQAQRARQSGKLDDACLVHSFFGELSCLECLQLAAWHTGWHLRQLELLPDAPRPPT